MFRKYVWICGAVICLGTAVTACGKGPGADGGDRTDGTVSTAGTAVPETSGLAVSAAVSGLAVSAADSGLAEGSAVTDPADAEQAVEETEESNPAAGTANGGDTAAAGNPVPSADILPTSAPELTLVDTLSSTWNRFVIQSGNFEWNVMEDGEVQSMVACGSHPLDAVMEQAERLKVSTYQRMDEVVYMLGCTVPPDRLTLVRWDASALGDMEAEAEETRTYEGDTSIYLKPGKVYEISAVWDHEKLEERGFSGTALYGFITE